MGATPADTEREITRLRGDMTAALEEVERRVRGGLRGVATAEARLSAARASEDAAERVRQNPTLLGVAGVVAAGAVAYGAYAVINNMRQRRTPQNRLKRGVQHVRDEVAERVEQLGENLDDSRRQIESAWQRGLLLKLDPEDGGYVRVSDARLEPLGKKATKRGRSTVIKKFIWAALLSVFMALGSVLAKRVADSVWRAMVHEDPPTDRKSARAES
jgi:hypothetical protein